VHIIYADDAIVVVNKPTGMPSLALRHSDTKTVANFLIAHFPDIVTVGPRQLEAGLAHRLDTETSGLLVAARTSHAYERLRAQFQERAVKKMYLALVEGVLSTEGRITFPLMSAGARGQHTRIATFPGSQEALTWYTPVEQLPRHTLIRVTIITGVRHQIRAHLAAIEHPIVGDSRYGAPADGSPTRLCLHAERLAFRHPLTGLRLSFTSAVPEDFALILQQLRHTKTRGSMFK
jgi:23S rRNA pseudouridine1911/1915/1917 synthase